MIKNTPFIKRVVSLTLLLGMFVIYYIGIDPNTNFLKDLPFGVGLLLTVNIFIIAIVGIILIEFIPDYFIDIIYGKESRLREKATETSEGAGMAMIAKSLRIAGYAVIVSAAIISYNLK